MCVVAFGLTIYFVLDARSLALDGLEANVVFAVVKRVAKVIPTPPITLVASAKKLAADLKAAIEKTNTEKTSVRRAAKFAATAEKLAADVKAAIETSTGTSIRRDTIALARARQVVIADPPFLPVVFAVPRAMRIDGSSVPPPLRDTVKASDGVAGVVFDSHATDNAPWWAWSRGSGGGGDISPPNYRCIPLNSQFSPPTVRTEYYSATDGRLIRSLDYGQFRIRWPRFIRSAHAVWFSMQSLVAWRTNSDSCVAAYNNKRLAAGWSELGAWSLLSPAPAVTPAYVTSKPRDGDGDWSLLDSPAPGGWAAPPDTSREWLYFCEQRYTVGKVTLTDGVVLSEAPGGHDCGPGGSVETLVNNAKQMSHLPTKTLPSLFWAVIPATWTWQHWCENTLPKMAQAMAGVSSTEVHGSDGPMWAGMAANQEILDDRFPIVTSIYRHVLGMSPVDIRDVPVSTPRAVYSCHAPPMHPFLWQLGQSSVFKLSAPKPLTARRKLVYCSRRDAKTTEHPGRLFLNEVEIVSMLRARCAALRPEPCEVVFFNHRDFNNSVAATTLFFSNAIGLISPHGGCLTNVNLLPCNAGVVEVMPLANEGGPPTEPHWHMLYMQAVMLEHRYYMLPVPAAVNTRDDMNVPVDELRDIVDEILAAAPITP